MTTWRDNSFRHHRSEDGFTLVEILITIVILGILAAIAVPIYNAQRKKSDDATLTANMMTSVNKLNQAKTAFGGLYPASLTPTAGKPAIVTSEVDGLVYKYTVPYTKQDFCLQGNYKDKVAFITSKSTISTTDCTYTYVSPAPANFSATIDTTFKPKARWDKVDNATTYNVYKDGVKVSSTASNNIILPAMTPASTALYWVRAVVGGVETDNSNKVSLTAPVPAPATGPILSYTQTSENGAAMTTLNKVSWTAVQYAAKYTLYDADTNVLVYSGTATSANVTVAKNDTKKYYVIASNDTGNSPKSNIITIAPKFVTPILTASQDDFTLEGTFSWQTMAATYGTGAKAVVMKSDATIPSAVVTTNTLSRTDLTRASSSWKVQITTGNGVVLNSNVVTLAPKAVPVVAISYVPVKQNLKATITSSPSTYGLTAANSSWKFEVSNTPSFAKTYPQTNENGTAPTTTTVENPTPTHGGLYYARYVITRNSDNATLPSAVQTISLPTRMMDVTNDGKSDVLILDNWNSVGQIMITPTLSSNGGVSMDYANPVRDPRVIGADCVVLPVQDLYGPGSKGFFCVRKKSVVNGYSGSIDYYSFDANGKVSAPILVGAGWNLYKETTVVQNFYGDDYPALVGARPDGGLEIWRGTANGIAGVNRSAGNGWNVASSDISVIKGVYDWNGYGSVGIMATTRYAPYNLYYQSKKDPTIAGQFQGYTSLLASWNSTIGTYNAYPTTASPNTIGAYTFSREYGNAYTGGKVVPVVGFGPQNWYDGFYGNGTGGFADLIINVGYPNESYRGYPGQAGRIR